MLFYARVYQEFGQGRLPHSLVTVTDFSEKADTHRKNIFDRSTTYRVHGMQHQARLILPQILISQFVFIVRSYDFS